jgi:pimeloyl-ACP methyl ester carboxylesterase
MQPSFLTTPRRRLAYSKQEGRSPTVMFCSGFKSDMTGSKATALAECCKERGNAYVRFDYSGHGASDGDFRDGTIGQWKADALAIFDALAGDDVVLVGSSMGAWIGLLMALERKERINKFVGIASAPDFTQRLIWDRLNAEQKRELMENGVYYAPSCYGEEPYPIMRSLIEEARAHLLLDGPIPLTCPITLLHGTKDEDVPVEVAYRLKEKLPHAELKIIEGGDHRLSSPEQLEMLCASLFTSPRA